MHGTAGRGITGVLRQPIQDSRTHSLADHGGGVEDAFDAEFKIIAAEPDGWSRRGPRAWQALCINWPASARLRVWGPGESPPSRPECQVAGPWPPVFAAAARGGPRHKLAWSRDGGDPKSLAHSFYRCAAARLPTVWPSMYLRGSFTPPNPPEVPEYVPTAPTYPARVKKRGPVLGGGLERGVRGGPAVILPKKTVQIPKDFLRVAGY